MGYIYRFVTPQAILANAREKIIFEKRAQGFRGPVGSLRLDTRDTIKAFLDYFDELGEKGWIYSGTAEYPDLPYGGCYVFRKSLGFKPAKKGIMAVEDSPMEEDDDRPLTEEEYAELKEEEKLDEVAYDIYDETKEDLGELMNASSQVVNEILLRQQRVVNEDEDPDTTSDLIDELEKSQSLEETKQEKSDKEVRSELYKQYENEKKGKKAIFRGKETQGFKDWLDKNKAEYDPSYKEYNEETGLLALKNEKETPEYKKWFKSKGSK